MKEYGTGLVSGDRLRKLLIMKSEYDNQIYLPISFNISKKKIIMIGGGKVAVHKLSSLLKFTTDITVIAPEINNEIKNDRRLNCICKIYEKSDLLNFNLVYACTNKRDLNAEIKEDANLMGLLVNVADDPELCDFISPAIYKNENLTVAVGSNAKDVKAAIRIRNWIKEKLDKNEIK